MKILVVEAEPKTGGCLQQGLPEAGSVIDDLAKPFAFSALLARAAAAGQAHRARRGGVRSAGAPVAPANCETRPATSGSTHGDVEEATPAEINVANPEVERSVAIELVTPCDAEAPHWRG